MRTILPFNSKCLLASSCRCPIPTLRQLPCFKPNVGQPFSRQQLHADRKDVVRFDEAVSSHRYPSGDAARQSTALAPCWLSYRTTLRTACTPLCWPPRNPALKLLSAIEADDKEVSPSMLYATAALLEGCSFVNGGSQNTMCGALQQLAQVKLKMPPNFLFSCCRIPGLDGTAREALPAFPASAPVSIFSRRACHWGG